MAKRDEILDALDEQFIQIRQEAVNMLDLIDDNVETMDGSSGIDSMTAYEAAMKAWNELHHHANVAIYDLCEETLLYAIKARQDAD